METSIFLNFCFTHCSIILKLNEWILFTNQILVFEEMSLLQKNLELAIAVQVWIDWWVRHFEYELRSEFQFSIRLAVFLKNFEFKMMDRIIIE